MRVFLLIINEGLGFRENSHTQPSVAAFNAAVRARGEYWTQLALCEQKFIKGGGIYRDGRPAELIF